MWLIIIILGLRHTTLFLTTQLIATYAIEIISYYP